MARAYHRVLKLACTIAYLAGADDIGPAHLAEAIRYRLRRVECGEAEGEKRLLARLNKREQIDS